MIQKKLRCAVIGAGRIGWEVHMPHICNHDGFILSAVVDPDHSRLTEVQEKFHPETVFTTMEPMLEDIHPDLVVIASPTPFHKEQTLSAFRYGCDVFCDKPVTLTLAETEFMFSEAKRLGRKLMAYQPHRVSSECCTAEAIIRSGKLGSIYLIERHISNFVRRNDWQAFRKNGGGMLLNFGSHYIDQLLYLLRATTARIKCELCNILSCGDAEDVVKALLTTTKGTLLEIDINQATALILPDWRICGTTGTATYEHKKWVIRYFDPAMLPMRSADQGFAAAGRHYPSENLPWVEEEVPPVHRKRSYYDDCYDFFALDKEPLVTAEDTTELMRTLELCRRSAEEI